jgi:glycosyltransferase involved in cell wall biosynthesis
MKIAVVTPYHGEDFATLAQCHRSVAAQLIACTHVLVADGRPSDKVANWNVEHVVLPRPHNDYGSTPRAIGSWHAAGLQFDGVAFLDADNWYDREHIASLLDLYEHSGAPFLTSSRLLCRLDGSVMRPCHVTDGTSFVDTSCMLLMREAFGLIANWCLMPDWAQIISDRVFLYYARAAGIKMAHSGKPTVYYRCGKAGIYHDLGEVPPQGVRPKPDYESALQRWSAAGNPPLVTS